MLRIENLKKIYISKSKDKITALNNINLDLPSKGLIFILGKNGSGKSTLLNLIGLMDKSTSGNIYLNDKNINEINKIDYKRYIISFVHQEFHIIKDLNVKQNIMVSKEIANSKKNIDEILENLEIKNLKKRYPYELSKGQLQRVAMARAIIKEPKIILADEPTGNLDDKNARKSMEILKKLSKDYLILVVSHDQDLANIYSDRIISLENGNIINDKTISSFEENLIKNEEIKRNEVKIKSIFKLSLSFLQFKKIRLLITLFIVSLFFAIYGIFNNLNHINLNKMKEDLYVEDNINYVSLAKIDELRNTRSISNINDTLKKTLKDFETMNFYKLDYPYSNNNMIYNYTIYNKDFFNNLKIIGQEPNDKNQIIITKYLYNKMFKKEFVSSNNNENKITILNTDLFICGVIDTEYDDNKINFLENDDNKNTKKYDSITEELEYSIHSCIYLYEDIFNSNLKFVSIKINENNLTNALKILEDYNSNYGYINTIEEDIFSLDLYISPMKKIINISAIILSIFSSLLLFYYLYIEIIDRKNDIGILYSLGYSNNQIFKIFYFQLLIFIIIINLFTNIFITITDNILNIKLNEKIFSHNFFYNKFYNVFTTFFLILLISVISNFIPLLITFKKNPKNIFTED